MKQKLLVLDDELLILKSLENLFEDDYEVYVTDNPEEALLLAGEHDIAVILCDERMPGVAGHEFLRRVREISNAARVMMSGYADITALTEAVNKRADLLLYRQTVGASRAEGSYQSCRGAFQTGPGSGAGA